ncbi:MAG: 3-deoxy-7-phosphoheptulonate synthase [Phycisphaerae bacterium]|nr:3-deoxy-7-phosphoheptulonate synthase [Phycisphaerae bacterium]
MMELTDNLNIVQFKPLFNPDQLKDKYPLNDQTAHLVAQSRQIIQAVLTNNDGRKLVIAGPCSLHDKAASLEYASKLKDLQSKISDKVLIVMRTYFEKPRTTLGWKGMIYDPYLDGSYDIEKGFLLARDILLEIGKIGLPCATEFLDPIVPQYLADLISWASIGARTTESQIHRQMASGLSMPIGFKNSTDGNLTASVDAIKSASSPHSFMGISRTGEVIIAETKGNKFGHLVMRGGTDCPNYGEEYVAFATVLLKKAKINTGLIIDCSHANSDKNYRKQKIALLDTAEQIKKGAAIISGVMLESFLVEGRQKPAKAETLVYGQSLTDECIGWEETDELIRKFAETLKA